ncbi:MAG: glycosyltransferase family 2 protein [Bdellovibrionota bacterium]
MATRPPLTVIIITLNEERNIARCLSSVGFASERVVVDSGSTDRTCEIAAAEGAVVLRHTWEGYGQQKNWALAQAREPWVLFLDADEELSPELQAEISEFVNANGKSAGQQFWGADFPRKTWFLGRWIMHGGWYPNRLVRLVNRKHARWTEPPVHETLELNEGAVKRMGSDLYHYTFSDVGDQVITNVRFSRLGAAAAAARGERGTIPRILLKPVGKFLETYLWKRGFLDGFPGLVISINAAHSLFMKYVELRFEKNSRRR